MSLAHYKSSQCKFPSAIEKLTFVCHPQIEKKTTYNAAIRLRLVRL